MLANLAKFRKARRAVRRCRGIPKLINLLDIDTEKVSFPEGVNSFQFLFYGPYLYLSIYIKVTVCTCVPFSRPNRRSNLHQILHRPPHQLREGS